MAKEREIYDLKRLQSQGCLTPNSSPRSPPPVPSSSPASIIDGLMRDTYLNPSSLLGPQGDRFFDSLDQHSRMYNSEGESIELTLSSGQGSEVAIAWDDDNSFRELSAIQRKSDLSTGLGEEGPFHSTLLNHTHGLSGSSSLCLEDVHFPPEGSGLRLRMEPIGEEAEAATPKTSGNNHGQFRLHSIHEEMDGTMAKGPYSEISHLSVFAYSMAVHQGSAPSTPLPRPGIPSSPKMVTFNSRAAQRQPSLEGLDNLETKQMNKELKRRLKKHKLSLRCFGSCATAANQTYQSLPVELPRTPPRDPAMEARPPCVGKEATPCVTHGHRGSCAQQFLNSPCLGQGCSLPNSFASSLNIGGPEERVPESTVDSDATGFMDHRLPGRRGVVNQDKRNRRVNIESRFKTLALV